MRKKLIAGIFALILFLFLFSKRELLMLLPLILTATEVKNSSDIIGEYLWEGSDCPIKVIFKKNGKFYGDGIACGKRKMLCGTWNLYGNNGVISFESIRESCYGIVNAPDNSAYKVGETVYISFRDESFNFDQDSFFEISPRLKKIK